MRGDLRHHDGGADHVGGALFAPVPAKGIGFQAGATPDVTLLVMNLFGFAMAFEIPSSGLIEMADELGRVARTMSAQGRQN